MGEYKCIKFDLYEMFNKVTLETLISEIKMSFHHKAKCIIYTEEYKRSENNMFVIIEVRGNKEDIDEAIKETQYSFDKLCEQSKHTTWDN